MPVTKIPNTRLFTGMYYKVGMKSHPNGWLTWTTKEHYLQIDLKPESLSLYEDGKSYQFSNEWSFGMTEIKHGYTLTNRGRPIGFLISSHATLGSALSAKIYDDTESRHRMAKNGIWRKQVMWSPSLTDETNYYKITNLDLLQSNNGGYLGLSRKMTTDDNYFVQVGHDGNDDSKFHFQSTYRIVGKMTSFRFEDLRDDRMNNKDTILISKDTYTNPNSVSVTATITKTIQTRDHITNQFYESLSMVNSIDVSFRGSLWSDDVSFTIPSGIKRNEAHAAEIIKELPLDTHQIQIPAMSSIEASIYQMIVTDIEVPFTAELELSGLMDRIVVDHPEEIIESAIPDHVLEDIVKYSDDKDIEFVERSGYKIKIKVSGIIRGRSARQLTISEKAIPLMGYQCGSEARAEE